MNRQEHLNAIVEHLGGREQLREYVDAKGVSIDQELPKQIGEVLGDYRPLGGIIVVGYESGHFWDTDTSEKIHRPEKWAPIPDIDEE